MRRPLGRLAFWVSCSRCDRDGRRPVPALAQSVSGTILGTVTDASGAVMAQRQGHDRQRRHRRSPARVTADANGEYTAPSLPTGRYTVIAR